MQVDRLCKLCASVEDELVKIETQVCAFWRLRHNAKIFLLFLQIHLETLMQISHALRISQILQGIYFTKKPLDRIDQGVFLVPVAGVEPAPCRQDWILSPARLPIPSHRRNIYYYSTYFLKCNT